MANAVDIFEREGIYYPQRTKIVPTSSPSTHIQAAQPSSWEDAAHAFGDTVLKVTLAVVVLAAFRAVRGKKTTKPKTLPEGSPIDSRASQPEYIINKCQRFILAATAIVIIGMLLFPPFHVMREGNEVMALGYHFGLLDSQDRSVWGCGSSWSTPSVDKQMLLIQLTATFLVGAIGTLVFHSRH
jgi:hypothetical protein